MVDQELLYAALYELCQRIEACGASPELTHAVTLCSDLHSAVGNKHNTPSTFAEKRVREAIKDSVLLTTTS